MIWMVVAFVVGAVLALVRARVRRGRVPRRRSLGPVVVDWDGMPSRLRDPETGEVL